jgi:general nucleoside transport system ATP-binding protein
LQSGTEILRMVNIQKSFPGVHALKGVNFCARSGEVHALLGENGAGKTTLVNILYGTHQADSGSIFFSGQKVNIKSPRDAIRLGIGMVHQHFKLIPALSVQENIILGLKTSGYPVLKFREVQERLNRLSEQYSLEVDPKALVSSLTIGERQRVEILKAIYRNARLLILDEPTAVFTAQEVEGLFSNIHLLIEGGCTVILIIHKLDEVMEIAERITVLRYGSFVETISKEGASKKQLARMMVGHEVNYEHHASESRPGKAILEIKKLTTYREDGRKALDNVSLDVRSGEILALAGISGNGQRDLVNSILFKISKRSLGDILIGGHSIRHLDTSSRIKAGLACIPEDRLGMGILPDFPITSNLALGMHDRRPFARHGLIQHNELSKNADTLIDEFDIRTPSRNLPARNLSGGNIQKMVSARELSKKPQVLIADKPTIGLDIGATDFIRQKLVGLKEQRKAVLLISEDLDEIFQISDRIAVISRGRIVHIDKKENLNREMVGLKMTA